MTACWRAGFRRVSRVLFVSVLASTLLAPLRPLQAASADLEPFYGAYVGVAMVEDLRTGETQQRDMDIVIEPYQEDGLMIHWVNVTLVDGRRDVPGVQRRVQTVLFEPADDREHYVEVAAANPFRERETTRPMRGDPVRWATVDGPRFHVYSFVVLEDGSYEMQIYDRVLTDKGIDIRFQRIVDGEVVRQIEGTTVRTGDTTPED
jgi:hypothetical protein